ncbi:hypothetical protein [Photobacterium phosphoreum]|uniref:hypothetical protein n=1 Tax=Photobacterium phosphoreum TaxID=659 RepID=UPI0015E6E802|nr:hypothetical protein [Photobacterium phosphoreum]
MKCKLKKYYEELTHFERQQPDELIYTKDIIIRLKEIMTQQENMIRHVNSNGVIYLSP